MEPGSIGQSQVHPPPRSADCRSGWPNKDPGTRHSPDASSSGSAAHAEHHCVAVVEARGQFLVTDKRGPRSPTVNQTEA